MLTPSILDVFANLDTTEQVRVFRTRQLTDTTAADAVLGYMAGMHHDRYTALIDALGREV